MPFYRANVIISWWVFNAKYTENDGIKKFKVRFMV
jgi:hypothetical protein